MKDWVKHSKKEKNLWVYIFSFPQYEYKQKYKSNSEAITSKMELEKLALITWKELLDLLERIIFDFKGIFVALFIWLW